MMNSLTTRFGLPSLCRKLVIDCPRCQVGARQQKELGGHGTHDASDEGMGSLTQSATGKFQLKLGCATLQG
jgi:hypothetical protein